MMTAIILGAGQGKRIGCNKLLLKIEDKYIIKYIIDTINKCDFAERIIITNMDEIYKMGVGNYNVHKNEHYETGQSSSIVKAIQVSDIKNDLMFFVGDQPLLSVDVINRCIDEFKKHQNKIIVPTYNNKNKSPVIFPNKYRDELQTLVGDTGGKAIISKYPQHVIHVPFDDARPFLDIDTIEDLRIVIEQGQG